MKTKGKEDLNEIKDFLKQRVNDFITYADRAYFEEENMEMYKYYLNRAKETIDSIEETNAKIKGIK